MPAAATPASAHLLTQISLPMLAPDAARGLEEGARRVLWRSTRAALLPGRTQRRALYGRPRPHGNH
jgi:hypothetical protein